ncbi:hypothetical protein H920_05159 [Fukomys damarensis]|uniref:Uncharacterized protein n=1 Tax=Fukomys damarensis TaxID=885580 RepID=A0A091DT20_FUKDA|nr:hypothetical protein H920_05159 [Fukomys damarensis]
MKSPTQVCIPKQVHTTSQFIASSLALPQGEARQFELQAVQRWTKWSNCSQGGPGRKESGFEDEKDLESPRNPAPFSEVEMVAENGHNRPKPYQSFLGQRSGTGTAALQLE